MNGKNLKYFVMGAAIVAAGLGAFAISLPAAFAPGEALSAAKFNDYFTRIKNAIDALEADNSVTTARLQDNAVTGAKIANGAVATAKIADSAVNATKTADEPGFNTISALADSSLSTSPQSKASITVNVPAQGFVVVTASFNWNPPFTGTPGTALAEFTLSRVAGEMLLADVHNLSAATSSGSELVSISKVFAVSPGSNSFHLNGIITNISPQVVSKIRMTAIYLPTRYGSGASVD